MTTDSEEGPVDAPPGSPLPGDIRAAAPSTPRIVWWLVAALAVLSIGLAVTITALVVSGDSQSSSGRSTAVTDSSVVPPAPTLSEMRIAALLADPNVRAWIDVCGNSLLATQAIRTGDADGYRDHIENAINLSPVHMTLMDEDPGPWLVQELQTLSTCVETVTVVGLSAEDEAVLNKVGERCLFWGDRVAARDVLMTLAAAEL